MQYTLDSFAQGEVLLFNKPLTWTSFNVVSKVRYLTKTKKVGHAGTLDPLATGLLVVCTGKFTKKINEYMGQEKAYEGTFTLGATTPSYDLETTPQNLCSCAHLTQAQIEAATLPFIGEILQMPPQHSAIKKDGVRLYETARQGIEVAVEPRKVHIKQFEITKIDLPVVHFKVVCGTGTYIRSLAHDFGAALGVGAYMSSLVRTRIGDLKLTDALDIADFEVYIKQLRAQQNNTDTTVA